MRKIGVRKATAEDKDKLVEWLAGTERNLIDWDVLSYPNTTFLCAYDLDSGEPLLFMPVQTVYVLESLGRGPNLSDLEMARCLEKFVDVVRWESKKAGVGEMYYPCADESVIGIGERHGFKQLSIPVLRAKI